jgi:hypothetical protein
MSLKETDCGMNWPRSEFRGNLMKLESSEKAGNLLAGGRTARFLRLIIIN